MIKKLIRQLLDRLFLRKFDDIKIQKGQIFEKHLDQNLKNIKSLNETYFKVFSQDTEDGVLQYFLKALKIDDVKFVEIGTQDYSESNTRYIYETMRCEGLIIDPTQNLNKKINSILRVWKNKMNIHNDYIDSENINEILSSYSFEKNIDLFSLDIDGIDYWVLESLPGKISKIFIAEYNPFFGDKNEITTPNIKRFDRFKYHESGFCWGASLKAIINLMIKKGYKFMGTNRLNCNAFFINEDYIKQINLSLPNTNQLKVFTDAKFNVFKKKNELTKSYDEIRKDLTDLKVFDLKTNSLNYFDKI